MGSEFHFAICQATCQDLLKREVSLRYPGLRLAYSRPGLVTFKGALGASEFSPWLALESGVSLGPAPPQGEPVPGVPAALGITALRIWRPNPDDGALSFDSDTSHVEAWRTRLRTSGISVPNQEDEGLSAEARTGQPKCLEVVESSNGASAWLGLTTQDLSCCAAVKPVVPPEGAPSRAYSKLVEAIDYFKLTLAPGRVVLELGAAPGGASLALLERGQHVLAVDPGQMSNELGAIAARKGLHFSHVQKKASALDRSDFVELPAPVEWIVSDINLAPPVALTQLVHAYSLVKKSARVFVVTFKINDEHALKSVPRALEQLAKLAGRPPKVRHLPSHRREFAVVVRV
jgi:23S rRNA (cytidine2498-2'-O)-methyltransferase